jgi:hypothetical protein
MQWQNTILDNNNASILDLLNFILGTRFLAHAHHCYVLRRHGTDNTNLPETRTKAKNLLDPDLDIFVRFGQSVWMARHGRVQLQETSVESKTGAKTRRDANVVD